jgi:hypothetical protein
MCSERRGHRVNSCKLQNFETCCSSDKRSVCMCRYVAYDGVTLARKLVPNSSVDISRLQLYIWLHITCSICFVQKW